MGLYDRDYMRKERKGSEEVQHSKLPDFENVKRFLGFSFLGFLFSSRAI
jgi:hypothetical protein